MASFLLTKITCYLPNAPLSLKGLYGRWEPFIRNLCINVNYPDNVHKLMWRPNWETFQKRK